MSAGLRLDAPGAGAATLGALRDWGATELGPLDGARLDAELLLADAAGVARSTVIAFPEREIGRDAAASYRAAVARRAAGEPLAYLLGRKEFYSLELEVTPDVLIPRPETELLVEQALERLPPDEARAVLDLGTGSGAIALAIKHARPHAEVTAVDASAAALAVAARNAAALGLGVRFVQSDWLAALAAERYDAIVCNPPYVRSDDPALDTLRFEPRAALDGGSDGLDAYRAVLVGARAHLRPDGVLLFEHGHGQRAGLAALAAPFGFAPAALLDDYAGRDRVVVLHCAL